MLPAPTTMLPRVVVDDVEDSAAAARGRSLATHQGAAGSRVGVGQVFGW